MKLALQIQDLKKTYSSGLEALKGLDLQVEQGDFFALLGPNGAGKSTTIGIICSLIKKSSGNVRVFDVDIDKNFSKAKQFLGVVPQEFNFNVFEKVRDILLNQAGYYGLPRSLALSRSEKYLKRLGLWEKRSVSSRELSGGMKRRLMIARALIHEPDLLILDEPTAGVDIELRRSMWEFLQDINDQGTTIILTTHYLEEAESLCRNVAIIDHGEIVANTSIKDLLKQLSKEKFILDARGKIDTSINIEGYEYQIVDDNCIEVVIDKTQSLNNFFDQLNQQKVEVVSMRNKVNRLEELFVSLVNAPESEK